MVSKMVLDAIGFSPANGAAFGTPVQDLAALTALASTTLTDKQVRLVESAGSIYRYDAQSLTVADGVKVVRPSNITASVAGRWHIQAVMSHAMLDNLADDNHTQYVHKDVARTIQAVHTFNPSAAGAPFLLGTNAQGQKVLGLNADLLDGKSIEDLILASQLGVAGGIATLGADGKVTSAQLLKLANGMPAYREPVSNILVSIASTGVNFTVSSTGTRNVYLNMLGDVASNTLGYILSRNAMLMSVTVASSANMGNSTNAVFQLRKNNSTTPVATYALPSGSFNKSFNGLNLQLNAGDELQCYLASSQTIPNPTMFLEIAWRD